MRPAHAVLAVLVVALLACGGGPVEEATAPAAPAAPSPSPGPEPEPPSAPEPEPAAEHRCQGGALVADPDPNGLNVRDAPGGEVLGQLPRHTQVSVHDARDGWILVADPWFPDHEGPDLPEGWVHGSLLSTDLKTPVEYGPGTQPLLYVAPRADARSAPIPLEPRPGVHLVGCEGSWLQVEIEGKRTRTGWLAAGDHCPSAVTTCP